MNIELKPIAESKVRQMGGDVCGVLVRNEAGAWAAVSEGGRVMWLDDFEGQPSSAQGGQGAEPVAFVGPTGYGAFFGETCEEVEKAAQNAGVTLNGTIPLYTQPQPAVQGSVPEGWKLVPIEPTKAMRDAAQDAFDRVAMITYQGIYTAMLAAAPQPPRDGA